MANANVPQGNEGKCMLVTTNSTPGKSAQRKRVYENVSCITVDADCTENGLKGLNYFDVPLEDYSKGCLTGTRIVFEMLKEAAQEESFDCLTRVMEEASKALGASGIEADVPSRRGAAVGVAGTLQEVFNFAASKLDFTEVFKSTFDYHEAYMAEQLEDMRKKNAEILASIKSSRDLVDTRSASEMGAANV